MNERLKQLIEQSEDSEHGFVIPEKFARLIVLECAKAAMIESKGHMNPIDLMKRMKERVGVEE